MVTRCPERCELIWASSKKWMVPYLNDEFCEDSDCGESKWVIDGSQIREAGPSDVS